MNLLLDKHGGKDERNIGFTRKLQRASQNEDMQLNKLNNTHVTKNWWWTPVHWKGKQFLLKQYQSSHILVIGKQLK